VMSTRSTRRFARDVPGRVAHGPHRAVIRPVTVTARRGSYGAERASVRVGTY
jgi:hypothetical protein